MRKLTCRDEIWFRWTMASPAAKMGAVLLAGFYVPLAIVTALNIIFGLPKWVAIVGGVWGLVVGIIASRL